jgi:hypothetical protein
LEIWKSSLERPRAHRHRNAVKWKLTQLDEPHVAPLNAWVRELRVACGGGESVPWFDPAGGGVHAPIVRLQGRAQSALAVRARKLRDRGSSASTTTTRPRRRAIDI